jgi:hypothetical protein
MAPSVPSDPDLMAVLGVVLLRVGIIERRYFGRHAGTRLVRRFWPLSFVDHGQLLSQPQQRNSRWTPGPNAGQPCGRRCSSRPPDGR